MFEPITSINDLQKFKKDLFNGKIFVFQQSDLSLSLAQAIKKKITEKYSGELESLHLIDKDEKISSDIVESLKNTEVFRNLFKEFLSKIGFYQGNSYWDKFRVRVAPANNKFGYRESSRIGTHRDTWGTNIHQQINWWAPVSNINDTNTMIFYPEYFLKAVKNSTLTWDLNTYLEKRKQNDFSYPSAPQLTEDLPENAQILPVDIKPGEILCFSGSHLHSSSKEKSEITRISYEIRTICEDDLNNNLQAPNIDCELRFQFPKIFRNISDNSTLKFTS